MNIIEANEKAYQERYGSSLKERMQDLLQTEELTEDLLMLYAGKFRETEAAGRMVHIGDVDFLLLIILGIADGSFIQEIQQKTGPLAQVIVFEPDEKLFLSTACTRDLSSVLSDERFTVVIYRDDFPDQVFSLLRQKIMISNYKSMGMLTVPGYEEPYKGVKGLLEQEIKEVTNRIESGEIFRKDKGNIPYRNELYAMSTLSENSVLSDMIKAIPTREMPVIIVAAGPSLMKNAGELARAKGKAIIVAAGHAAAALQKKGIVPDLVAASDPITGARFLSYDTDRKYRILADVQADRPLQEAYRGRCIYHGFTPGMFPFSFLPPQPLIYPPGGSVATQMFCLFRTVGFTRFILIGQDLAYDEKGHSHTDGENDRVSTDRIIKNGVMGLNGHLLDTRGEWLGFLHYYERELQNHPEVRMIDATEGGALIRGTEIMTLAEAIDQECDASFPIDEWLDGIPEALSIEEQDQLNREMSAYVGLLGNLRDDIAEEIACGRQIAQTMDTDGLISDSYREECDRYDQLYHSILDSKAGDLLTYFCEVGMQDYVSAAMRYEQNKDAKGKLDSEIRMFTGMLEQIDPLMSDLREFFTEPTKGRTAYV